jgi:hypothetical protein
MSVNGLANAGIVTQLAMVHTMLPKVKELIDQQIEEIELLKINSVRYQWLRNEFAHGRETYIGESMPSGEKLDEYIDEQLRKAQEK